jgi:hypothetical protein
MEKNKRGKVNALDLVELLIVIVLGWIGERLLDSLWKGTLGRIRKKLARRKSNEASIEILRKLANKALLLEARYLGIDPKEVELRHRYERQQEEKIRRARTSKAHADSTTNLSIQR